MPKRRRLLTPLKNRSKAARVREQEVSKEQEKEESTPRGRLKGALLDVLDPFVDESDTSTDHSPHKRERIRRDYTSDDDERSRASPPRQSYVLKLFDRSVDLSQFNEDSPLYPICRAWIINQPKANYKDLGNHKKLPQAANTEESVELPGPEGPIVSRIPELIPEQLNCSKDNINLNYREAAPPSRAALLARHAARWAAVRGAWLRRAAAAELRYAATQRVLDNINANAM